MDQRCVAYRGQNLAWREKANMDATSRSADAEPRLVARKRRINSEDTDLDARDSDDVSEAEFEDDMIKQLVQQAVEATKDETVWRRQGDTYVQVPNMSYKP
ncbi:hypothetical protein pdul_cds_615 [Pandoravirus dulcis]|uniref:Uncharacterized protein n=1 Tax=Pandoravirus dulcis TaxID=1349409 RepID=S4VXD6_9VIRU|nr:hypothetical protein pdul_cds_615 [Pandoravirus dulcis]AGO82741.1 hypothetical protein pdul_cds_615 [Pandoravirus dulcis]